MYMYLCDSLLYQLYNCSNFQLIILSPMSLAVYGNLVNLQAPHYCKPNLKRPTWRSLSGSPARDEEGSW
jgi:hypothetical protein